MSADVTARRLRSLATEDEPPALPPSQVDLGRVLKIGRRRRRLRGLAATGSAAAAVATVAVVVGTWAAVDHRPLVAPTSSATAAVAEPTVAACRVERLQGPWGGTPQLVMDPTGRYLAGYIDESRGGRRHAVMWTAGAFTELHLPVAAPTPMAVNSRGMIAGRAQRNQQSTGWLFHDGTFVELHQPPGAKAVFVNGMNANGDVVGEAEFSDGRGMAVVWWFGSSEATLLSNAANSVAFAIDDNGTAYGTLGDGDQAAYWPKGQPARSLPGPDGGNVGKVFHVAGGWAIGVGAAGPDGEARWVVWNLATHGSRWTAPLGLAEVEAVNAQGWLAGSTEGLGSRKPSRPAVRRYGVTQVLPPLNEDQTTGTADGISADGHTVTGTFDPGPFDPTAGGAAPEDRVIWHC